MQAMLCAAALRQTWQRGSTAQAIACGTVVIDM